MFARSIRNFCLLVGLVLTTLCNAEDADSQKPLQLFDLKIGDKTVTVVEGETLDVAGVFTNPKITLTPRPTRLFKRPGIEFEFPRQFTFEADLTGDFSHSWTFAGNDLRIMYFETKGPLTPSQLANTMMQSYGLENSEIVDPKARFQVGEVSFPGINMDVQAVGQRMRIEVYQLPKFHQKHRILMFQDSLDHKKQGTAEGQASKEMLSKTLKVVP